jgi:hypothetical protein
MLTDNFYKNVFNVILEDSKKLKDSFMNSIFSTEVFDAKSHGKTVMIQWFDVYFNAIKIWCEQNDTSTSFTPSSFIPELNPTIKQIMTPPKAEDPTGASNNEEGE